MRPEADTDTDRGASARPDPDTTRLAALHAALGALPVAPGLANPYTTARTGLDRDASAPARRRAHLDAYLRLRIGHARILLIAEAPGYQGARFSGLAMTCERTLVGAKPDVPAGSVLPDAANTGRTSAAAAGRNRPERDHGFCEPTASIVWRALVHHGLERQTVLWNTFPLHPHRPGQPLTNRTPTDGEVQAGAPVLDLMLALFPGARPVAVGRTAARHLAASGIEAPALRHPANGGAGAFRRGLAEIARTLR